MSSFLPVTKENIHDVEGYLSRSTSGFCDFTPFVLTMWQRMYKTEYTVCDSVLYLRYVIDGKIFYSAVTDDIPPALEALRSFSDFTCLTLVSEAGLESLRAEKIEFDFITNPDWGDYVYLHEKISTLVGKKYAGQRNHINKFESLFPDWKYEKITPDNALYVAEFFESISDKTGDEVHDYEALMVKEYLKDFKSFPMSAGFVCGGGKIVSFAVGEVLSDMLFVHVEKADKNVPGAYPIIAREFARANPAKLINREEDMGVPGLRTSKLSWHPHTILQKYLVTLKPEQTQ